MGNNTIWIISICFGGLAVALCSWSRFDEPSYDSGSEYFARYKPRFATSHRRYRWAQWAYVWAIISVYFVFSLTPELYKRISGSPDLDSSSIPLAVALGIITLQNIPVLNDLERRVRGFLHSFARIPDGVRRTVAQMRGSQLNFGSAAITAQTRKIGLKNGNGSQKPGALNKLILEDDILHTWYSIGCVLFELSENNRGKIGIDPLFFDYYKDELDSIDARHLTFAEPVRQHLSAYFPANGSPRRPSAPDQDDPAAFRNLRDLRDRLYTFVACGVHSSVKTDAESFEILRRLGFTLDRSLDPIRLGPLAGLSLIAVTILSIFTVFSAQIFLDRELLPLHGLVTNADDWIKALHFPRETIGLFMWSWTTALFYFAAIIGSLWVRNTRVARREWFDINNLDRARPIPRYVAPTLVGTALGSAALFIIAFLGGPGFKSSFTDSVGEAMHEALPWFPLAMVMALIAVVLSDADLGDERLRWRKIMVRSLCGGLVMGLVAYVDSRMIVYFWISGAPAEVIKVGRHLSLFHAAQIGLFAAVLCGIVQVSELYTARARSLVGKRLKAVTWQGPMFCMSFDPAGQAALLSTNGSGAPHALCQGEWQQFPEGTAVKWTTGKEEIRRKAGAFGLISAYGDSLIYEGYAERFSGAAEFTAQVHLGAGLQ